MFAVALLDLILAATTTANRIPGGLLTRVAGHAFLLFGTLSVFLALPIAFTSNRRAQRWLGRNWKWVHRFVYAVWATILIHLAFLFAFRQFFVDALIVSAPLLVMRLHPVRRQFVTWRTDRAHQRSRWICGLLLLGIFAYGLYPSFPEIVSTGAGAFTLHPVA
jgi:sulfoxide reductase heme-binding subunit YedZ